MKLQAKSLNRDEEILTLSWQLSRIRTKQQKKPAMTCRLFPGEAKQAGCCSWCLPAYMRSWECHLLACELLHNACTKPAAKSNMTANVKIK